MLLAKQYCCYLHSGITSLPVSYIYPILRLYIFTSTTVTYRVCYGSIIDQNINTTMFIFNEIMECFQTLLISHIQLMKPGLQTQLK
jgi:hypothetical protein